MHLFVTLSCATEFTNVNFILSGHTSAVTKVNINTWWPNSAPRMRHRGTGSTSVVATLRRCQWIQQFNSVLGKVLITRWMSVDIKRWNSQYWTKYGSEWQEICRCLADFRKITGDSDVPMSWLASEWHHSMCSRPPTSTVLIFQCLRFGNHVV